MLKKVHEEGRAVLLEHEAYALVAEAGLPVPRHVFVPAGTTPTDEDLAGLGEELVLKVTSPDVLHKSDVGGVRMLSNDPAAVRAAIAEMLETVAGQMPDADLRGVLAVERIAFDADRPGTEFLLSVRRDPAFGPVIMFGLGGLLSEWYGKLAKGDAHLLFAAEDFDAEAALNALEATPAGRIALQKSRLHAEAPLDRAALGAALQGLAKLATAASEPGELRLEELEINPIAAVEGRPVALDALARVGVTPPVARPARPVAKIRKLLHPRSAVVYGASTKGYNPGRIILKNLRQSEGIQYGHLYAIHPKAETIDDIPCYVNATALPETVDLAIISIPAHMAPEAIDELIREKKAHAIILIPGGFAETGEGDLAKQITDLLGASRESADGGPVMVGGNCLGIVSKREYNTFFLPTYKLPFHKAPGENLAAISQSGAYLVTFTSNLDLVIFPRASVSYGNEMDLTASDFLQYYLEHETDTKVLVFYIEGFQPDEGERFLRLARKARQSGRAVIVYKAGKTDAGAKAAASHTASIAGNYKVAQALLRGTGAVVCETLNEFEDYTKILTMLSDHSSTGKRVGVITNAGFEAGVVSDHLHGLSMAEFSDETRGKLAEVLPAIAHVGNPVDVTPMTNTEQFVQATKIIAEAPEVDLLIVSPIPATPSLDILPPDPSGEHRENIYAEHSLVTQLGRFFKTLEKPMICSIDSGTLYDPSVLLLERFGIPVYRKIDRASRALGIFARFQAGRTQV